MKKATGIGMNITPGNYGTVGGRRAYVWEVIRGTAFGYVEWCFSIRRCTTWEAETGICQERYDWDLTRRNIGGRDALQEKPEIDGKEKVQ